MTEIKGNSFFFYVLLFYIGNNLRKSRIICKYLFYLKIKVLFNSDIYVKVNKVYYILLLIYVFLL